MVAWGGEGVDCRKCGWPANAGVTFQVVRRHTNWGFPTLNRPPSKYVLAQRLANQYMSSAFYTRAAMNLIKYNPPSESGLTKDSVDHIASSVARQVAYSPGGDLVSIVTRLGGTISVQNVWDIADKSSGSIRINAPNDFEISLASHTGPTRDRFTIAHELGHYILHYIWPRQQGHVVGPIEAKRYGTGRVEWEANWFAAGFLMPRDIFVQSSTESRGNLSILSQRFQVSLEAARIRQEYLGLT
jgi:hypothetical protein